MSSSPPILLAWQDGLAIVTLNRPERANVLDDACAQALAEVTHTLLEGARSGRLRAVLLTAAGPVFCAGGDIQGFVRAGSDLAGALDRGIPPLHALIQALASLPVPVVSALNGPLGGGGIGLALLADIVLAADTAKLRGGYASIGLSPDVGASWALTRLAGPMRAKQILFSARAFSAQECLAFGLYAQVLPPDELMPAALALATELAQGATGSFAQIKSLVDGVAGRSLEEHLALEHQGMVRCGASADAAEGVRAFLAKRAPQFKGHAA
ncbi:enoyl-CoA hydratase-related protein [Xenophilus arseniciresistens]|uniref:Enoyl-CoA hydratase-related protein n=1 Tax=Xenophilus arseniciresistens TaxID=1283306 RepID=A0AAE3N7J2_9BURK|nr:enoyl-CoA hydratase-related protein [Xenophilus arseniciresistens]MDA7415974.1 enoyl-CoA hydratase-related protein [Xenophilus arseniciresistens]